MTAQYALREDAEHFDRTIDRLSLDIEEAEKRIVELRRQRDVARFHRAEASAAADVLDNMGFRVALDGAGQVVVSVDPPATPEASR